MLDKKKFFVSALVFFSIFTVFARDVSIFVKDGDLDLPLDGAIVHANGKEFLCNDSGIAIISVPDDKPIVLQITYPGYGNERLVVRNDNTKQYDVSMHLESVLSNKELVFTADRLESGTGTESGRSVSIADKELSRTSEIGFLEDVMTAIKLLPGVGYTNMFNAMPSIRGGDPGDLIAALDGFYIENPYFWGGGISIFDPHMIESVRLSHGIFSARYGRTISGLLELKSKTPSSDSAEIEVGVSTSAANLNVSLPINKNGGIMIMGKVTYWDGYISFIKALSNYIEEFESIESVTTAPYIRVASFTGDYRFSNDMFLTFSGFIGGDGVGAAYENTLEINNKENHLDMNFIWDNLQGFLITGLTFNPKPSMALKMNIGGGFLKEYIDADFNNDIDLDYNPQFKEYMKDKYGWITSKDSYNLNNQLLLKTNTITYTAQGRLDYDLDIGKGFLFSAGIEEFYSKWTSNQSFEGANDIRVPYVPVPGTSNFIEDGYINAIIPVVPIDIKSQFLTSAAFSLLEYKSSGKKFGAELGLRLDHLYLMGKDFSIQTYPVLNPRLNLDYNIFRNKKRVDSFDVTLGTGLFSSLMNDVIGIQSKDGIDDFELKQNRSWTSVAGFKIGFLSKYTFNIEGYYKYIFDRGYTVRETNDEKSEIDFRFDGEGRVWGFDFMLQKLESKYIDGWVSYTFNYARYHNPTMVSNEGEPIESYWRFPVFHRFHNLNLVLNIKPSKRFNIATRFGFASGAPKPVAGKITSYPVLVQRAGEDPYFIQKYKRTMYYSDTERDGFSLPLDVKFSFFTFNKSGKTQGEIYLAVENLLSFIKTRQTNTSFDSNTGEEIEGSDTASYQLPIPMISFGFTWSY